MNELSELNTLLITATAQINSYQAKPTKAESARIRKTLGQIKKDVTPVRAVLVAADKA